MRMAVPYVYTHMVRMYVPYAYGIKYMYGTEHTLISGCYIICNIGAQLENGLSDPSTPAHTRFGKSYRSKPVFFMDCFHDMSFVTRATPIHSIDLI